MTTAQQHRAARRLKRLERRAGMSYTFALLPVSESAYREIANKLRACGHTQAFTRTLFEDAEVTAIDMRGIALVVDQAGEVEPTPAPQQQARPARATGRKAGARR